MESELLLDALLERQALFEGEGVGLGNDGNNVDNIGELLKDNNVNGLEAKVRVSSMTPGAWKTWGISGVKLTHGQRAG